jgi:signal transduction histidine kinase
MIRFNEAIDQALAESISFFSAQVDQARDLLLGMLGHDMRTPLQTIQMTAAYLSRINAGEEISAAAGRLITSGTRMKELLDDLVDFNRSKLGVGLQVDRADVDLGELFSNELDLLRGAYPDRRLELAVTGNTQGNWDGPRLQRVLRNLVVNAIKHGAPEGPVRVLVIEDQTGIRFEVRNPGAVIEPGRIEAPLQAGKPVRPSPNRQTADEGLGLGLYIVREIAKAHGGEVKMRSDQEETIFAVCLPR